MRFLIAGLGSVGRRHLRNLLALGETDLVLLRSGQGTLPPDPDLDGLATERDLTAALAFKPDGVIVSNPTALHLDVAIPAARAGCHLFLEKPLSASFDHVRELETAAKEQGVRVMVGFQYRYHPGLLTARRLLQEEAIGRPVAARAHYGDYLPAWHPWEDYRRSYSASAELGGGVVLTLCHPLDYVPWILGEVAEISAQTGVLGGLGIDVEDTADITLRLSRGTLATIHLNYLQQPPMHRFEVIGTTGSLSWDQVDGGVRVFREARRGWEVFPTPPSFERNDMFLAEMRRFVDVVRGQAEPEPDLQDGLHALRLALIAREAARQKKTLPFA
jgi:predicted dehydrogenase